jgi:rhodanese-related sulfurtransferase
MAQTAEAVKEITRDQLKTKIDRNETMVLLETLAPEHFHVAHLPGAVNMPPDRVKELAPELVPDKQTPVITYCAGSKCHASLDAARELASLGYTNVSHYPGGKQDWTVARLPLEKGKEDTPVR